MTIDGRNLLPLATGEADALDRDTLFWQSGYYRAVRHGDWKLQVSDYPDKRWLYHLAEDPTDPGIGTLLANTNQIGAFGFGEVVPGYIEKNVSQIQSTPACQKSCVVMPLFCGMM